MCVMCVFSMCARTCAYARAWCVRVASARMYARTDVYVHVCARVCARVRTCMCSCACASTPHTKRTLRPSPATDLPSVGRLSLQPPCRVLLAAVRTTATARRTRRAPSTVRAPNTSQAPSVNRTPVRDSSHLVRDLSRRLLWFPGARFDRDRSIPKNS